MTRRRVMVGIVSALVMVAAFVVLWFEPQARWLDDDHVSLGGLAGNSASLPLSWTERA